MIFWNHCLKNDAFPILFLIWLYIFAAVFTQNYEGSVSDVHSAWWLVTVQVLYTLQCILCKY